MNQFVPAHGRTRIEARRPAGPGVHGRGAPVGGRRGHEQSDPARVSGRRDRLRSAGISDYYSGTVIEAIFETAADLRLSRAAVEARAEDRGIAAADYRRRQDVHVQDQEGHSFHARSGVQGQKRELTAEDYVVFDQALSRSRRPLAVRVPVRRQDRRPGRARPTRRRRPAGSTTTRKIAGLEMPDRYTLRIRLKQPDYNFSHVLAFTRRPARSRAK